MKVILQISRALNVSDEHDIITGTDPRTTINISLIRLSQRVWPTGLKCLPYVTTNDDIG